MDFDINGNIVNLHAGIANALKRARTLYPVIMGLTNGWTPCIYLECLCTNPADADEVAKQKQLLPYIEECSTWVLNLTGDKARRYAGKVAYTAPVVNIDGSFGAGMMALDNAMHNLESVRGHQRGRLVWAES